MIASGDFSGNPALLQSSFGIKGHFELVVPRAASGLFYFRRDNDPGAHLAWRGPFEFATDTGQIESVCLIQSNFGQPGVGQLEVVVRIGNALAHFIRLTDESPYVWSGPHFFAEGVTGIPALIQGTFGARGNYELVVPRRDAGLAHYFRNNDPVQNLTWYHTADFGLGLGRVDLSSLVQTNWGAGSLFVVARHRRQGPGPRSRKVRSRRAAGDDTIAGVEDFVYFERIDLPPHAWSGPHSFLSHLTVQVMPFPVAIGRSVRVTVTARDAVNRAPVDGAEVLIDDDPTDTVGPVVIGQTNVPFRHTFQAITVRTFNPESRRWETDTIYPVGSVRAPGYVEAPIDWGFPP